MTECVSVATRLAISWTTLPPAVRKEQPLYVADLVILLLQCVDHTLGK